MSSSIPNGNHSLKADLVERGYQAALKRKDFSQELVAKNPLLAISAMGDPMQAVVAGMAIECIERGIEFTLAGGSQMIAIAGLVEKILVILSEAKGSPCYALLEMTEINVVTTPWVVNDKSARIQDLLALCCRRTKLSAATNIPDELKDLPLEAYNQGHVKEGVGAGALILLSS
jgi:NaMN:DMB phosphoribosyltransferase